MILRIEDTDQTRFVPGAEQYIVESLDWCGIKFDESDYVCGDFGPYKQSNRKHLYKQYSDELLAKGCAYIFFDTAEENYWKRYYKGELPRKQTFESLVLSTDPKFVQKRWQTAHVQDYASNVSTFCRLYN